MRPWSVRILGSRGVSGAGVLLDDQHILTCAHVVGQHEPEPFAVDFPAIAGGGVLRAEVIEGGWFPVEADERGDVAIARLLDPLQPGAAPAPLGRRAARDTPVRIYGYPQGIDTGVWATARLDEAAGPGAEWVQLEAAQVTGHRIEQGFSGAGVEADGKVIGIVVAEDSAAEAKVAWMLPLATIAALWPQLNALLPGSLELDPAFVQHFEPRSRGVQRTSQRGWFFTGRTAALTELAAWLASDDDTSRVVTGSPGSGKSAVLSRLVVCSDPALRALLPAADLAKAAPQTLPPVGSIDVAVHATGKTTEQVAAQIAAALDLNVAPALLPAVLAERDEPVTIAIDALDEAAFREDLVLKLVQPLVAEGVRLLLGARRDLLPLLRTGIVHLDLDDEAYFEVSDIAAYVSAYLREAPAGPRRPNPYLGSASDLPEMIGTAVAHSAAGNFLIAQLVALELVSRAQPVEPLRRDWDAFPSRVGDAMRIYLEAVGASVPGGYRWVRDLLAPLAYAEGTDLGDQLWADLATELGGDDYDKGDLHRLRADTGAAALLTTSGTGWRLFHQALAEYLREELGRGGVTEYEAHRTIAARLLAEVPGGEAERRWWEAAPYVLTNLGRHAVSGGLLEDLVLDPGFLLWGDQDRQLPLLGRVHRPAARAAADCYLLAAHEIGASGTAEDAATVLRITAQLRGADEFAARIARLHPEGWSVAWRDWRPSITHRVLLGHRGSVAAVALGTAHGRAVAVTGGRDGVTVVWDLETGAVLHPLAQTAGPTWRSLRITALAAGDGVAVVGDNTGRAELWDLETGRSIRVITEEYSGIEGVALSGDGVTVVTAGWVDGSAVVRVWDAATGAALRTLTGHDGAVTEVALVESGGRTVVIGGGGGTDVGALHAWDLETGRHLRRIGKAPRSQQEGGWLRTLSAVQVDGRALVLTAETVGSLDDGLVRIWDVESGRLLRGFPNEPKPSLWSMAAGWSGGRLLAVTAGDIDGAVQLWDALTGQFLGDLAGHTQKVEATALGELNGRSVAVTGDIGATVRVWDLDVDPGRHGPQPEVSQVRTGTVAGRAVLVTAEVSTIAVRDPDTGEIVRELRGHPTRVRAISLCEVDGRASAVSTGSYGDGLAHVWDLETGRLLHRLDGGGTSLGPLVTGVLGDQVVAATVNGDTDGERSGEVRVWDVATGARLHLLACGAYGADALALGTAGGRQILVTGSGRDATVRVWDLETGQLIRTMAGNRNYIRTVTVTELAGRPVLVTGGGDVCLWDLTDGTKLSTFGNHRTLMTCVNFGEFEGRLIAVTVSIGDDRRIALWSVPDGAFLGDYEGTAGWVGFADLVTLHGSPTIVAPDEDGAVHLWELKTGAVTRLTFGSKVHDVVVADDDLIVAANAGLTRLSYTTMS